MYKGSFGVIGAAGFWISPEPFTPSVYLFSGDTKSAARAGCQLITGSPASWAPSDKM